ncbi:hypothetical protein KR51_00009240 [Rubidibacter lacunae KORDI 51-2]|uniref:Cytochrome b6-f complex subunit 6 n=1 Tax=Rubidibacter lacunae KORDI 51-2 TaxID=582515 RepID=U5DL37_9CHRO|nr:cytochrome b6-f complex subunit PetL [Rubidibacter lacunae]ERN42401.1 hypothetical protein KR51_00009240 [Rubidibacter lacunae KORDI 51-2]
MAAVVYLGILVGFTAFAFGLYYGLRAAKII